ncbi:MAG: TolC family protein [Gammaproteobacteria bacterium]|nr:TolC family protein [Gammaproteobacteria bacterium]MDH5272212.1 TolC family protein [Gammaproteobacteria bacterium]
MTLNRMILRWSVAFVLSGAAAGVVRAETLADAWALALQQDHSLAAARNQAEAAGFEAQAARAQRWPTLAVGGSYTQLDDSPAFDFSFTGLPLTPPELFKDDNFLMGSATVTVPLFTSGRISSSIAAAEARERGVGAQVSAATSDVKLAVADAYVGVLRARKAHGVARSNVQTLEALTRDTTSMFERELVPKNELLAVQVALADARQNELRAANAAEVAAAAYNRRLGAPLDRPVELSETLAVPAELSQDLPALVAQAQSRRTELAAFDAQAEAYGELARTERSRVLPQVALSGGYQYLENQFLDDETVGMAGIGVQWAMFDGGQSRKRAAALDRNRRATEQQRADASSQIELQVRQAYLGIQESRQRVIVTAQAAEQADENLRIAHERYTAGLGTQTQLLEAETLRVQALRNRDDATLDAGLAQLRLARAVGAL